MYTGKNKVWMHYVNDIVASDVGSAVFLSSFLRHQRLYKLYLQNFEAIDLHKYKVLKSAGKVRNAVQKMAQDVPFIFLISKN